MKLDWWPHCRDRRPTFCSMLICTVSIINHLNSYVSLTIIVFCYVTLSSVGKNRRFRGTCCHQIQGTRRMTEPQPTRSNLYYHLCRKLTCDASGKWPAGETVRSSMWMYGKCKYKLSKNAKYNTIKVDFTEICSAWILLASNGADELLWIRRWTFVFAGGVSDFILTSYVPPIVVGRKTTPTDAYGLGVGTKWWVVLHSWGINLYVILSHTCDNYVVVHGQDKKCKEDVHIT